MQAQQQQTFTGVGTHHVGRVMHMGAAGNGQDTTPTHQQVLATGNLGTSMALHPSTCQ